MDLQILRENHQTELYSASNTKCYTEGGGQKYIIATELISLRDTEISRSLQIALRDATGLAPSIEQQAEIWLICFLFYRELFLPEKSVRKTITQHGYDKETAKKISVLARKAWKIQTEGLSSDVPVLTIDDMRLIKEYANILTNKNVILNFDEDLAVKLATHLELIKESVRLVTSFNQEDLKKNCFHEFLTAFPQDLAPSPAVPIELLLVPDEWKHDPEICMGIAMRDKAHHKRGEQLLILTKSELDILGEGRKTLNMCNVYKISTLMHPGDCDQRVCDQIGDLSEAASLQTPPVLEEIVLRQCFSAGHRTMIAAAYSSSPVSIAEDTEQENISKILQHGDEHISDTTWQHFRTYPELNTRPVDMAAGKDAVVDEEANLAKLLRTLRSREGIDSKLPNLLVKGYYGPVTPSRIGENIYMRPAMERAARGHSSATVPSRFFKSTRIAVFDSKAPKDHQKRNLP